MTPLQFPKKPDFSSPEWQRENHLKNLQAEANVLNWKLLDLNDRREQIEQEIEITEEKYAAIDQELRKEGIHP